MKTLISIDDTDNHHSPGSGQLADELAQELIFCRLATNASTISRHQLFVHDLVPYTSHNSAMCFSVSIDQNDYSDLVAFCQDFLRLRSAEGSDPGLCVTRERYGAGTDLLIEFGLRAKSTILSKPAAYHTAEQAGVHLSEHGGSGEGVIGALAGVGLRLYGSDGRIRGWHSAGVPGKTITVEKLCADLQVSWAVDTQGTRLPGYTRVTISNEKIKKVLHDHCPVVVLSKAEQRGFDWTTLSPAESKLY